MVGHETWTELDVHDRHYRQRNMVPGKDFMVSIHKKVNGCKSLKQKISDVGLC